MEDHRVARGSLDRPGRTAYGHAMIGEDRDGACALRVLWLAYDEVSFYGLPALLDRLPVVRARKVCREVGAFEQWITKERYDVCVLPLGEHTDALASLVLRRDARLVLTLPAGAESLSARMAYDREPDAWLFERRIGSAELLDVFERLAKKRTPQAGVSPKTALLGRSPKHGLGRVTDRERSVLRLLCRGESNQRIANALGISIHGVKRHLSHLMLKLDCSNRTELALTAARLGFPLPFEDQP
ncbi:hypothetical protein GCM10017673_25880 [Streptosporangium violaceochromogenes]|nr:hypothetical protein GCM10017673_25880 [Streptosporangium violaceochromogenes]